MRGFGARLLALTVALGAIWLVFSTSQVREARAPSIDGKPSDAASSPPKLSGNLLPLPDSAPTVAIEPERGPSAYIRFIDEQGNPIAAVTGTYRKVGIEAQPEVSFQSGPDGMVEFGATSIGTLHHVQAQHADFSGWTGDLWAVGTATLRLLKGCFVTLRISGDWQRYAGEDVSFTVDGERRTARISSERVPLGIFAGGALRVLSVGADAPGGDSAGRYAIPLSGAYDIQYVPRRPTRPTVEFLTTPIRAEQARLSFVSGWFDLRGRSMPTHVLDYERLAIFGDTQRGAPAYYFAASEGQFAAGMIPQEAIQQSSAPLQLTLEWATGSNVEFHLPETIMAGQLYLLRLGAPVDVRVPDQRAGVLGELESRDVFHIEFSRFAPPAIAAWPGLPTIDGSRISWKGVPPRAEVLARVTARSGQVYEAKAEAPLSGQTSAVAAPRNARVEVVALDAAGEPYEQPLEVTFSRDGVPGAVSTVMHAGHLQLASTSAGSRVRAVASGNGFYAEEVIDFIDGAEVVLRNSIQNELAPSVRVESRDGRPLEGVTVAFHPQSGRIGYGRTNADGIAIAPNPGPWFRRARVDAASGYQSEFVDIGNAVTRIVATPSTTLKVMFMHSMGVVRVRLLAEDRPTTPGRESVLAFFTGEAPAGSSITWPNIRDGNFAIEVTTGDQEWREIHREALSVQGTLTSRTLAIEIP